MTMYSLVIQIINLIKKLTKLKKKKKINKLSLSIVKWLLHLPVSFINLFYKCKPFFFALHKAIVQGR